MPSRRIFSEDIVDIARHRVPCILARQESTLQLDDFRRLPREGALYLGGATPPRRNARKVRSPGMGYLARTKRPPTKRPPSWGWIGLGECCWSSRWRSNCN